MCLFPFLWVLAFPLAFKHKASNLKLLLSQVGLGDTIDTANTINTPSISMANGATIEVLPIYTIQ